jgi:hypothetical protein
VFLLRPPRRLAAATTEKGSNPLANVRIRGKIPKEEWPKIAARFKNGESFTQIARSYQCTAPAIRYIVARTSTRDGRSKREREAQGKVAKLASLARPRKPTADATSAGKEIWGRINLDIATFLAAIEALSSDDSDENYRALLDATDRLLWGTARTRLHLERALTRSKRGQSLRRVSG